MANEATTDDAEADDHEWDSIPNRQPDIVATHKSSRFASDEEQEDFKHLFGDTFNGYSTKQDPERAIRTGDYARVTYTSRQSGNPLTRHGEVEQGFVPEKGTMGSGSNHIKIDDTDENGKYLSVRSDGYTTLERRKSPRYGSGKQRRSKLGSASKIEVWFSDERQQMDDPFGMPDAEPGDYIRFEYDGQTRIEQVRAVQKNRDPDTGNPTGHVRYKLKYSYDRRDEDGNDPDPEWVTTAPADQTYSHHVEEIDVVETVTPADYAVTPDEWKVAHKEKNRIVMEGYQDGELVAERVFKQTATNYLHKRDMIAGEDNHGWIGAEITPDADKLAERIDLPVEGASTGEVDE